MISGTQPAQIVFDRELLCQSLFDELMPLLAAHWKEVAVYQDILLNPDWEVYRKAEAGGSVRAYTVRRDGVLLGYSIYFLRSNPHYKQSLQAQQDVIFITPPARGRTGFNFIKWCDEQLAIDGVAVVYHHVKVAHNFGPMLERIGYKLVDLIYARRLD